MYLMLFAHNASIFFILGLSHHFIHRQRKNNCQDQFPFTLWALFSRFSELSPVVWCFSINGVVHLNECVSLWLRLGFSFKGMWKKERTSFVVLDGAVGQCIGALSVGTWRQLGLWEALYRKKKKNSAIALLCSFPAGEMLKGIPWPSQSWWMRHSSQNWGTPGDLSAWVSTPEVLNVLAFLSCPWDLVLLRPLLIVTWSQNTSVSAHHKKGNIDSWLSLSSWHLLYFIPKLCRDGRCLCLEVTHLLPTG